MKIGYPERIVVLLALMALPVGVQAQLSFTTNNGAITITGFSGSGAVVIPDTTNGRPVVSIQNSAFFGNTAITSIIIPDSVTNIGGGICFGCSGLTNVTVGNGVIAIGNGTFYSCGNLATFTIALPSPTIYLPVAANWRPSRFPGTSPVSASLRSINAPA
jgi:hypothetical protein